MRYQNWITGLTLAVMILAAVAAAGGVFMTGGPGPATHLSVHGQEVELYGRGLYRYMSAELAVQGIAQDYVTLFLAVPLLGAGLIWASTGSAAGKLFLAGMLGYTLVTYLFYLVMAMYNAFFLLYAALLGLSFHALLLTLFEITIPELEELFAGGKPVRFAGGFLVVNGVNVGLLWLGRVAPPLLDGSIYPESLEHYTTLIVQGLDLGLLLPFSIILGVLLWRRTPMGLLGAPVYLVFLSVMMIALVAKIIAIGMAGGEIVPPVFVIPPAAVVTIYCAVRMLQAPKPAAAVAG